MVTREEGHISRKSATLPILKRWGPSVHQIFGTPTYAQMV